ncbi:MAG: adenylosuccinate synthase [Bacteroidota bacterium]|nr:adenylosuccinate synthase [Bacteroidota bacterium]
MKIDIILGLQWGDEGKGKVVDSITPNYDVIARFQGGPNAGHTVEFEKQKFVLHTVPSGIYRKDTLNIIGNGVIIDPVILMKEIEKLSSAGISTEENLLISKRAHLILPTHRLMDAALEASKGASKIGSTLKGIGPTYTDKIARHGIRIGNIDDPEFQAHYNHLKEEHLSIIRHLGFDFSNFKLDGICLSDYEKKWFESLKSLRKYRFIDSEQFLNTCLDDGKKILAEGAQGTMLDVDFGSYPFVTSSNTISAGVCSGLGISPHRIGNIFGLFKAYCTRVGAGPFPTELKDEMGDTLRNQGNEFGSTTGRPRRCGWLDLPALKYSIMLNGVDSLIMTKTDVLNNLDEIKICTEYKMNGKPLKGYPFDVLSTELEPVYDTLKGWNRSLDDVTSFQKMPEELKQYIAYIEKYLKVPVEMVSVGPDRTQIIKK